MPAMRERKQRQKHPRVQIAFRLQGHALSMMGNMTQAQRDSFVATALRDALKGKK